VTRVRRRQLGLLSVSFFTASGLGLLLLIVVARWLTPTENFHFQAVWGLIFAFGSVLGSVEQEVTRRSTSAALDGRRTPVGAVQAIALAAMASLVVLAALLATPRGGEVVQGSAPVIALVVLSVINFSVLILVRGLLLGAHALRGYAALLVGEALVRLVLLGVLVLAGVAAAVEWAVLATVTGSLVWVVTLRRLAHAVDWSVPRDPWRQVAGTVTALGIANGLSALVLTGFPTVSIALLGQSTDLAVLMAVITLARAPLALLAPVQALTVPTVVRWSRSGDTHRLSRALQYIAGSSAVAAVVAAAIGYVLGPSAVAFVLGADYRPGPVMAALVAASTCVMAGALLQAAALVALQRYWQLTACWAAAITSAALLMLIAPWGAEQRGLGGFTLASVVAFGATAIAVSRTVAAAGRREEETAH
jgi:O-antigen/teichoic acid export membrane protein